MFPWCSCLQFPLQDETAALKAVALAQRHGLTGSAAGLARRLGMAAAAGGRTAAALQWFMRAHDPARCAELVAPLLAKVQQQLLEQVGLRCIQVQWSRTSRTTQHQLGMAL
jgi:hypothetical protein